MVNKIFHYIGESDNPYYNLALEQYLMETVPEDACILYLWQNRHTVVIGRNQNAWAECRTTELNRDGGHLARRLSGGGAVYHDMGNLNFTFLVPKKHYDLQKQLQVIVTACRNLGIEAEVAGRNDVTVAGRKFSGNAFYDSHGKAYHHGTLLIDVDMSKLGQYLMPSKAKLQSKGVDSVRSRVTNLKEFAPDLTVERMKAEMLHAFETVYDLRSTALKEADFDGASIRSLEERNASWEWNYGKSLPADFSCGGKFSWGEIDLRLTVRQGTVAEAAVYTDSMDWNLSREIETALLGCRFEAEALKAALPERVRADLSALIDEQNL